jgi:hypothetical protein
MNKESIKNILKYLLIILFICVHVYQIFVFFTTPFSEEMLPCTLLGLLPLLIILILTSIKIRRFFGSIIFSWLSLILITYVFLIILLVIWGGEWSWVFNMLFLVYFIIFPVLYYSKIVLKKINIENKQEKKKFVVYGVFIPVVLYYFFFAYFIYLFVSTIGNITSVFL